MLTPLVIRRICRHLAGNVTRADDEEHTILLGKPVDEARKWAEVAIEGAGWIAHREIDDFDAGRNGRTIAFWLHHAAYRLVHEIDKESIRRHTFSPANWIRLENRPHVERTWLRLTAAVEVAVRHERGDGGAVLL